MKKYIFKTEEEARAYAQESGATPVYVTVRREDGAVCGAMKMEGVGDAK